MGEAKRAQHIILLISSLRKKEEKKINDNGVIFEYILQESIKSKETENEDTTYC